VLGLAVVACGTSPTEAAARGDDVDLDKVPTISRSAWMSRAPAPAGTTCTETVGACRVRTCEGIPNDTVLMLTETCCNASGSCEVEHYALCGGC